MEQGTDVRTPAPPSNIIEIEFTPPVARKAIETELDYIDRQASEFAHYSSCTTDRRKGYANQIAMTTRMIRLLLPIAIQQPKVKIASRPGRVGRPRIKNVLEIASVIELLLVRYRWKEIRVVLKKQMGIDRAVSTLRGYLYRARKECSKNILGHK